MARPDARAAAPRRPWMEMLPGARARFGRFLEGLDRTGRVFVLCHFDADGLASGALLGRSLPRLGFEDVRVEPSRRGESPYTNAGRTRLRAAEPDALVVADLGVRRAGVLDGTPTLILDHHRPEGMPRGAVVVSSYGWEPPINTAWLALELLRGRVDVRDLEWLAAVGTIGDLGASAPWPELPRLRKRYGAGHLQEAVSLINAARRSSAFDVTTPLRILLERDHPRAFAASPEAGRLRAYRDEVQRELKRARRAAPAFSKELPLALIHLDSACQVHPLVAESWRRRLARFAVVAANRGYLPGVVAFSARTERRDLNLPAMFRSVDLGPELNQRFGFGHDRASGGHLPPEAFNRLLDALGFPASARVPV